MNRFLALALIFLPLAGCGEKDPVVVSRDRAGGTDLTFFVASDLHFGQPGIAELNRRMVEQMNALPGTPYPNSADGDVQTPRGLLIDGDLTNAGFGGQWRQFEELYGLTGKERLLKYPVFECTGNHDRSGLLFPPVLSQVRKRHGELVYSWNWQDLHVVCLDLYPDAAALRFLRADLAAVGRTLPVVLYFHYPLSGPYSDGWSEREKAAFARAIEGYNVVAIFTGHFHHNRHYRWRGIDVYGIGSPRHSAHFLYAVRLTDDHLTVASWDWDRAAWAWTHTKPVNGAPGEESGLRGIEDSDLAPARR